MSIRNAVFSLITIILFCGPVGLFLAQKVVQADLPAWATSEDAMYLAGSKPDVNVKATASLSGFKEGTFQVALQEEIGNFIPVKALVLLGNAEIQRNCIALSNVFFNWKCYPTFYGSDRVYIPEENAITGMAAKQTPEWQNGYALFLSKMKEIATDNEDIDFVIYLASTNGNAAEHNPTYSLISNSRSYHEIVSQTQDEIDGANLPNLSFAFADYEDAAAYYDDYYRSDGHWNIKGTIKAYEKICEELGYPVIDYGSLVESKEQLFSGDVSRTGLMYLPVPTCDVAFDFSNLTATYENGKVENLGTHQDYERASDLERLYNYYGLYYGMYHDATIVGGIGSCDTLLVGDSFSRSLARLIAESGHTTYRSNALFAAQKRKTALADHIKKNDIDTVIFVATPDNYASFLSRNPNFFPRNK